jgi:hypothetical protein
MNTFYNDTNKFAILARTYNILLYSKKLKILVGDLLGAENAQSMTKYELHSAINKALIDNYSGESSIKAFLVKEFLAKNVVASFEIRVKNSRVDFLTINGETTSFEIKSELDNLQKLSRQTENYSRVFEYNYIVIDRKHLARADTIIPDNYGIWIYSNNKKQVFRKAKKNLVLDSRMQLQLLTKKELQKTFSETDREIIIENPPLESINLHFKQCLKERYFKRWEYLKIHQQSIFPIDYQFFFNKNVNPSIIYQGSL